MPPSQSPIQEEIEGLLRKAEAMTPGVIDLTKTLLKQFRDEVVAALDFHQVETMEVISSGSFEGIEALHAERDRRIDVARNKLKGALEKLLKIAEEKGI
jgi:hypothetical protein